MITSQQFRPFLVGAGTEGLNPLQRINWKYFLQRIPMVLFASVSSYGVGHLLSISGLPFPFDYLGAISFDAGFLGAIALSDMQLTKSRWSNIAYYVLNLVMSGLAALFNVLSHAAGKYANITPEDITVGIPFALVGLAFALFYHSIMNQHIDNEIKAQEKQEQKAAETAYKCKFCGEGKPNMNAVYGHYKTCSKRTMHLKTPGKEICKCLLCQSD